MAFNLNISIIIPVYNAERFLEKSVQSALQFGCVKEVILIEDASPDNALDVCKKLVLEDSRIKLFQHPNGENRGAGASRNLGLEKASCEFIAFLDADDWFESNRFDAEEKYFQDTSVDGIYGATGFYYENEKRFDLNKLTTISSGISKKDLFYETIRPSGGRFTTDAITIRKSLLSKTGVFDISLRLHQDSHLWNRIVFFGNMKEGIVDVPVSFRRVHDNNRITTQNPKTQATYHIKTFEYFFKQKNTDSRAMRILFITYVIGKLAQNDKKNTKVNRFVQALIQIFKQPSILSKII